MQRRKFLAGLGSVAAGGAAVMGTGAFEGAYVAAERTMNVSVEGDNSAYLRLVATSPYASYETKSGGAEDGADKLVINMDQLNADADTRIDDVFRVQNTTGSDVTLKILDGKETATNFVDYNEASQEEDAFQIFADANDGSGGIGTRIDTGAGVLLGPGDSVSINIMALLKGNDPGHLPEEMLVIADGTS